MKRWSALVLAMVAAGCASERRNDSFTGTDLLASSRQHVLVIVESRSDSTGWLYRYARGDSGWRVTAPGVPVSVGVAGVAKEREGDKRAPSGAYRLTSVFGYEAHAPAGVRMPYLALQPETECVDDPDSRFYNQVVNPAEVGGKTWSSSEMMRRDLHNQDDLYELGLLVAYNPEGKKETGSGKGAGSCIFLHIWRGPARPTVGCTAMPEEDMRALVAWLDSAAAPLLVQGSREELQRLAGKLPYEAPPKHL